MSVAYDNVTDAGLEAFRKLSGERAMALLQELDAELSPYDRDLNPDARAEGEGATRTGLGVYYIEDGKSVMSSVEPDPVRPRPCPSGAASRSCSPAPRSAAACSTNEDPVQDGRDRRPRASVPRSPKVPATRSSSRRRPGPTSRPRPSRTSSPPA